MEDDGLPNARPIALSDSPRCQRSHNSVFSAAVNPRRYPCPIDGKSQADWGDIFYKFGREQQQKMYTEPFSGTPIIKKGKTSVLETVNILYAGDVVPAGKKRTLIEMDQAQSKFLQEIERGVLVSIQTKFMAAAYAAPIRITICSLSGRACNSVGDADQCGKTLRLPRRARPIRPENEFED
jgi:hypothetical protein